MAVGGVKVRVALVELQLGELTLVVTIKVLESDGAITCEPQNRSVVKLKFGTSTVRSPNLCSLTDR
jgi:hypothetical protein